MITFKVDLKPLPLKRPRFFKKFVYDPSKKDKKEWINIAKKYAPEKPLELALQIIEDTGHMSLPVVDEYGALYGIITWADIHMASIKHERHMTIDDYCVTDLITVTPEYNLSQALDSLGRREISHLPVVDKLNPKKLLGIVTKGDLIKAYNRQKSLRKEMSWKD